MELTRRSFVWGSLALLGTLGACLGGGSRAAHTVSVYGDRDYAYDVTVTVENEDGETLFERDYALDDGNEAEENEPFPESTDPATVRVLVDGEEFERGWPAFADPRSCGGSNWEGVEVWISGRPPAVRIGSNCQHVTMDG